jgi:hemerythrin superfamily protein
MNVLKVLKKDHLTVKSLYSKFDRTGRSSVEKRGELFEQIRRELLIHAQAEQEIFYPMIKAFDDKGRYLIVDAQAEHREIDQVLMQITRLRVQDPRFSEKMETLMDLVDHHFEEEEGQIFQFAEENCPTAQLEAAGTAMEERKRVLERELAA